MLKGSGGVFVRRETRFLLLLLVHEVVINWTHLLTGGHHIRGFYWLVLWRNGLRRDLLVCILLLDTGRESSCLLLRTEKLVLRSKWLLFHAWVSLLLQIIICALHIETRLFIFIRERNFGRNLLGQLPPFRFHWVKLVGVISKVRVIWKGLRSWFLRVDKSNILVFIHIVLLGKV